MVEQPPSSLEVEGQQDHHPENEQQLQATITANSKATLHQQQQNISTNLIKDLNVNEAKQEQQMSKAMDQENITAKSPVSIKQQQQPDKAITTNNIPLHHEITVTPLQGDLTEPVNVSPRNTPPLPSLSAAPVSASASLTSSVLTEGSKLKVTKHQHPHSQQGSERHAEVMRDNEDINDKRKDKEERHKDKHYQQSSSSRHHKSEMYHQERGEERRERRNSYRCQQDEDQGNKVHSSSGYGGISKSTSSSGKKHHRQQRRSPTTHKTPSPVATILSNLSCDTCCQLEWEQQQQQQHSAKDYMQSHGASTASYTSTVTPSTPQTLKPPTLHIGLAGQPPTRVSKRKSSNTSGGSNSKERASKTKPEIKTKIIYTNETVTESNNITTTTITTTTTRETGSGKTTTTTKEAKTTTRKENKPCSDEMKSTKQEEQEAQDENKLQLKEEKRKITGKHKETLGKYRDKIKNTMEIERDENIEDNPDILQEIKEISQAITALKQEAETNVADEAEHNSKNANDTDEQLREDKQDNVKQHVANAENVDSETNGTQDKELRQHDANEVNDAGETDVYDILDDSKVAAAAAADNEADADAETETSTLTPSSHATKLAGEGNNVDGANVADTAASAGDGDGGLVAVPPLRTSTVTSTATSTSTLTTTTATANATNTTNISCNSEFAGVTTLSQQNRYAFLFSSFNSKTLKFKENVCVFF